MGRGWGWGVRHIKSFSNFVFRILFHICIDNRRWLSPIPAVVHYPEAPGNTYISRRHTMNSSPSSIEVILVGYGEISRSQHAPILESSKVFSLQAIVDPPLLSKEVQEVCTPAPFYASLNEAIEMHPSIKVCVIACIPSVSQDYASAALDAGLSVFMEKPPGIDHRRLNELENIARSKHLTLFTGYHSTASPAIQQAKEWVERNNPMKEIRIEWKENASKWHPHQEWITQENGFGVLDILFNPLSIMEELLGAKSMEELVLETSSILIPRNWSTPISGSSTLYFASANKCRVFADYAWNHEDDDIWKICFTSSSGHTMDLNDGGAQIIISGRNESHVRSESNILRPEYEQLYARLHQLLVRKESEVRPAPLRLVNEIFVHSSVRRGDNYFLKS